jgi:dynein heavy chain
MCLISIALPFASFPFASFVHRYAKVFRDVEPRRIALRKAEVSLKKKADELGEAEEMLREVVGKVQKLQDVFQQSELEQTTLSKEAGLLEAKLAGAAKLVEGLSGEKTRWEASIKGYQNDIKNLVGDCAIAAAFLSYASPFPSAYREYLLKKSWLPVVRKLNLPCSPSFELQSFLSSPTDVMDWNIQGLPTDPTSIENAVIIKSYQRWSLSIDPQGQANMWIKAHEGKQLKVIDFQTPNYGLQIENAMVYGIPLLIQDVGEELDPSLDAVFRMTGLDQEKKAMIMFGDKELSYNPSFRLYLTTKLQNPHYKPEVSIKCAVVNFAVKEKGLQDQLLGIVVRMEQPKLENDKADLVRTVAASKRKLVELEDSILTLLASGGGENNANYSLVDDLDLINALQLSKTTSEDVKLKLEAAQQTEQRIDAAREVYRTCAVRASMCFFVINDLSLVDPMYQFSLAAYVELFKNSISASRGGSGDGDKQDSSMHMLQQQQSQSVDLVDRCAALNEFHTEAVFKYTARALFEKHKLIFAFQLTAQKLQQEGKIDQAEWDFFLRGGQILDRSTRPPNPCPDWLSELAWDNVTELDKLPLFKNLAHSFEQNASEWRSWYRSDEPPPEKLQPPGDWQSNGKRDIFQQMLVLRCLRPDRVVFAARAFIAANLGPQYVESPPFDLLDIFKTSSSVTPLIFVLSPGVDPLPMLQQLAKQLGGQPLFQISLGQGQAPIAAELIEQGIKHGHWVFLANTHLSIKWLPELDKIVERIALLPAKERHPHFRLWMSADPTPEFPISLLQSSVKMTTEPPKGLRANMQRLYANITDEQFNRCRKPDRYRKLLFGLCWFHSLLVERKKFRFLGFNTAYAFNDSDFAVCENLLSLYLDEFEETPFDALRYLIAQANYGGRVTDAIDRRLLDVYSAQLFTEGALQVPKFPLSSLDTYYIPEDGPLESYRRYIASLPKADADPPEAFGQHPNADIASQMDETKTLLSTILSLQPRTVVEGAKSREDSVLELIGQLLEQIPPEFDIKAVSRAHEGDRSPLTIVLLQEMDRYNQLLSVVMRSLRDLQKGIKGLVVISPELEEMMECLFAAAVPPAWHMAYPSLKPLGPWTRDLGQRIAQLSNWAASETPKVYWLSGFTFPVGFLTALLQVSARKNGVSIESLTWDFVVMGASEQAINMRPKEGAYVKGLYLEGARWDTDNACLAEPYPMELTCPMPIIHFKPVEQRKKSSKGLHACPTYIYPNRAGTPQQPSFLCEVDLKSGPRDSHFWTKRGVALLLSASEEA